MNNIISEPIAASPKARQRLADYIREKWDAEEGETLAYVGDILGDAGVMFPDDAESFIESNFGDAQSCDDLEESIQQQVYAFAGASHDILQFLELYRARKALGEKAFLVPYSRRNGIRVYGYAAVVEGVLQVSFKGSVHSSPVGEMDKDAHVKRVLKEIVNKQKVAAPS